MSQTQLPASLGKAAVIGEGFHTPASTRQLQSVLRSASQRWRSATLIGLVFVGLAVWIAVLLIAVTLDASFGFPGWALALIDAALIAVAAGGVVAVLRGVARTRHDARRVAVAMEQHGQAPPSQLINAIDLGHTPTPKNPMSLKKTNAGEKPTSPSRDALLSPTLRHLAIEQGENAATQLDPGVLVNRVVLRRAAAAAALAVAVILVSALGMPRVFSAVGPRLLSPWADLPPYTPLRFEVAVGPETIHVGKPAAIEVTLTLPDTLAPLPSQATIVFVSETNEKLTAPMHRTFREGDASPASHAASPHPLSTSAASDRSASDRNTAPAIYIIPTRFSYRFERLDAPVTFYIDTPDGRSKRYTVTPDTTPLFESLHASVLPPDYAGLKTATQRLKLNENASSKNLVRALRGSAVTLTAESNVPLDHVVLIDEQAGGEPRQFPRGNTLQETRQLQATFIVQASGTYTLSLVGRDGKASLGSVSFEVVALQDHAPSVDIVSPQPSALAVEGWPVPVDLVAKDDVGLRSLTLRVTLDQQPLDAVPLIAPAASDAAPRRSVNTRHTLDLAALQTKPGQILKFFATTRDNLPTAHGGPPNDVGQLAETPIFQVQIISQEQWNQLARQRYGMEQLQAEIEAIQAELGKLAEARQDLLEKLNKLQEKAAASNPLSEAELQQLQKLRDKAASGQQLSESELQQLQELHQRQSKAAAADPLNDVERQQLQELQEQLEAFAEEAQKLAEALTERAAQPSIYEFEEPYREKLRELAEQLEAQAKQARSTKKAASTLSLPGVTPTQLDEFAKQVEAFEQEDQPFDEAMQEELEEFAEDLIKLELAEEMIFHAERIRRVIVQQRELEVKLSELQWREPEDLSADESQRLVGYAAQQRLMREELEDAALMLGEVAELSGPLLPRMSGSALVLCENLDDLLVYPDMEFGADYAEMFETAMAHASAQVAADKLESLLSDTQNVSGESSGDLDGSLSLPKSNLQNAMQQMAQSRGLGLGNKPGGGGRGSGGNRPTGSLIGPRMFGQGDANSHAGANANGRGKHGDLMNLLNPHLGDVEALSPDAATTRHHAAISVPGVPPRYQNIAAAYFQRLAEEAARQEK